MTFRSAGDCNVGAARSDRGTLSRSQLHRRVAIQPSLGRCHLGAPDVEVGAGLRRNEVLHCPLPRGFRLNARRSEGCQRLLQPGFVLVPLRVARATIVQRHADREDQVVSRLVAGKPAVGVVVPSRDGRDGGHPEELVVGDRCCFSQAKPSGLSAEERSAYEQLDFVYKQCSTRTHGAVQRGQIASFVETFRRDGFPAPTMTNERSSRHLPRKHVDLSAHREAYRNATPRLHTRTFKEKPWFGTARGRSHPLSRPSDATASSCSHANSIRRSCAPGRTCLPRCSRSTSSWRGI